MSLPSFQKDGKYISWTHVRRLYDRDQRKSGLKLLTKLKREHIELTSYSRMRASLAAQVCYECVQCGYMFLFVNAGS